MDYAQYLANKAFSDVASGFDVAPRNAYLFDFQRAVVQWALRRGRAGIYADTGLGKTLMQGSWAEEVAAYTGGSVLIVAPLCVAQQTVEELARFGITVSYVRSASAIDHHGIYVANYEMLDHFDLSEFAGLVLDESSILKHQTSKTRADIIARSRSIPYRLSCTATPSPNDTMELGSQSEFLGIMSSVEMLAMFFVHDGGETNKWRLKGHGKQKFWQWLATWSVVLRKPSDLGYSDEGYDLPGLNIIDHVVEVDAGAGDLFAPIAQTLQDRRAAQRDTIAARCAVIADLVNASDAQWLIWCHLNAESEALKQAIPDAIEVRGSDSASQKEQRLMDFTHGRARVLVTKPSIAGFGMNWQHCNTMAFVGLSDSFEQFYQAVRRCYRFGQQSVVDVHLVHAESEGAVKANLERKQRQHDELSSSMIAHMRDYMRINQEQATMEKTPYVRDVARGDDWELHLADCVDLASEIEDNSVGLAVFSPPFASLYTYSNSDRDMGNCADNDAFYAHFSYLVEQLYRVLIPGRHVSFHCMNVPMTKLRDDAIGIRDFRGELIRLFENHGFIFHSEVTIWKDPVTQMQRTKALGLLHKTIRKDSSMSRMAMPDYLITMRKPGENPQPISHERDAFPVSMWQRWASPVWMDINPSRTLQYRSARDNDDERHICPLQLDVIERAIYLWSNPGDLVFSPFAGIGSEGYEALRMRRRFIGSELKPSYFSAAKKNLESARFGQADLYSGVA
jgi:DNA modification methylase